MQHTKQSKCAAGRVQVFSTRPVRKLSTPVRPPSTPKSSHNSSSHLRPVNASPPHQQQQQLPPPVLDRRPYQDLASLELLNAPLQGPATRPAPADSATTTTNTPHPKSRLSSSHPRLLSPHTPLPHHSPPNQLAQLLSNHVSTPSTPHSMLSAPPSASKSTHPLHTSRAAFSNTKPTPNEAWLKKKLGESLDCDDANTKKLAKCLDPGFYRFPNLKRLGHALGECKFEGDAIARGYFLAILGGTLKRLGADPPDPKDEFDTNICDVFRVINLVSSPTEIPPTVLGSYMNPADLYNDICLTLDPQGATENEKEIARHNQMEMIFQLLYPSKGTLFNNATKVLDQKKPQPSALFKPDPASQQLAERLQRSIEAVSLSDFKAMFEEANATKDGGADWVSVVPLSPTAEAGIAGRDAHHSNSILPPHHLVMSGYTVQFLNLTQAISRKQCGKDQFQHFRFLDQEPHGSESDQQDFITRLQHLPLTRICAEAGMGKSSALISAFALAMNDEQCKYKNIALTFSHERINYRVVYNRTNSRWAIQPVTNPYVIPEDTLHFVDVADFDDSSRAAENYQNKLQLVQNATLGHKNSSTIMVSPTPWQVALIGGPKDDKPMSSVILDRSFDAFSALPLVYDSGPRYVPHFRSFIQSMLLRRWEAALHLGPGDEVKGAIKAAIKQQHPFTFYQRFFPAKPDETELAHHCHFMSFAFLRSPDLNPRSWRLNNNPIELPCALVVEEAVSRAHGKYFAQFAELKPALMKGAEVYVQAQLKKAQVQAQHDREMNQEEEAIQSNPGVLRTADQKNDNDDPFDLLQKDLHPLDWITAYLKLVPVENNRQSHVVQRLFFDLKSTLPWEEFATTLRQDVRSLAAFAPTLRSMIYALSPIPSSRISPWIQAQRVHLFQGCFLKDLEFIHRSTTTSALLPLNAALNANAFDSHSTNSTNRLNTRNGNGNAVLTRFQELASKSLLGGLDVNLNVLLNKQLRALPLSAVLQCLDDTGEMPTRPGTNAPIHLGYTKFADNYSTLSTKQVLSEDGGAPLNPSHELLATSVQKAFQSPPKDGKSYVIFPNQGCKGCGAAVVANHQGTLHFQILAFQDADSSLQVQVPDCDYLLTIAKALRSEWQWQWDPEAETQLPATAQDLLQLLLDKQNNAPTPAMYFKFSFVLLKSGHGELKYDEKSSLRPAVLNADLPPV